MTNTRLTDPEVLEFRYPVRARGFPHPQRLGRDAADGTPATASAAPSASWKRWNARSCPVTAACGRSGSPAAKPGQVGENCGAAQGRPHREAARLRRDRDRRRRGDHHPDADRRIWQAGSAILKFIGSRLLSMRYRCADLAADARAPGLRRPPDLSKLSQFRTIKDRRATALLAAPGVPQSTPCAPG